MNDLSKKDRYDVLPWIEKYRPHSFDEIISHEIVIDSLKKTIKDNKLQHLLFHGPPGTGKCLAPDTPIIMFDGNKKLAEYVKVGDLLMGDDNSPRKVLSTTTGTDMMYCIQQDEGDNYVINSEHIISLRLCKPFIEKTLDNNYKLKWFEDYELKEKIFDDIKSELDYKKDLINNKINNNKVNKKGDICDISIKRYLEKLEKEKDWISAWKGFKASKITCWEKKKVPFDPYTLGYWLGIDIPGTNRIAYNYENSLNINIIKTYILTNKGIPIDYKINDVQVRLNVLAGFLDANSNISSTNFEFFQKSRNIFDDIIFIARSLGLAVSIIKSKIINGSEYYGAIIYENRMEEIPVKINKKKYKYHKNRLNYDIKVKKLFHGKYCGFEIDSNGRFLLGDFTITHNTSMVMACARELYGNKMDLMMLNINASEERGIEVVRTRIQQFVNAKIIHSEDNKCIFKLVILDEADAMTQDAQAMLRKVVEKYSYCTRFCLICNYIKKITPALQSRCACYRFPLLKPEDITKEILKVSKIENINISEKGIDTVIKRSKGDMRKVLNILQSTSMSYDMVTDITVNKCIGYPNIEDINLMMKSLINDNFETSYKIVSAIKTENSYSLQDIISEISSILIEMVNNPNNNNKNNNIYGLNVNLIIAILKKLSQIEYNLTTCVTESLQLYALIAAFRLNTQ